jgi:hypothetical protein
MTEDLKYWIKFSFDKMKKDGTLMPNTISKILEMDKFRNSGISEDQLRAGIKERFANERKKIIENARENLPKLNVKD